MQSKWNLINQLTGRATFAGLLFASLLAACAPPPSHDDLSSLQDAERNGVEFSRPITLKVEVEVETNARDADLEPFFGALRDSGFNQFQKSASSNTQAPNYRAVVLGSRVSTASAIEVQALLATLRRQLPSPAKFTWSVSQTVKDATANRS